MVGPVLNRSPKPLPPRPPAWPWPRVGATAFDVRWVRLAAFAGVVIAVVTLVGAIITYQPTSDLPAFLRAADRISRGLTPYGPVPANTHAWLYAPWFAVVFIPLTWLPFAVASALWHLVLAAAAILSLWPLARSRTLEGLLAVSLIGAFEFHAVWAGHFEPLMIVMLVYGLRTRWGPVAIGVAASIKITPIVLCLRYAGCGNWRGAALALGVAALMWTPALLFSLDGWGLPVGQTLSLLGYSSVGWAIIALLAVGAAWHLAPTRYGWLAAVVAWLAVMPRLLAYDIGALAVAATPSHVDSTERVRSGQTLWALRNRRNRSLVPVDLAPATLLGAADERRLRRQEDGIGSG